MRIKHETVKGFWKESILIHFEINCKKMKLMNTINKQQVGICISKRGNWDAFVL